MKKIEKALAGASGSPFASIQVYFHVINTGSSFYNDDVTDTRINDQISAFASSGVLTLAAIDRTTNAG